MTYIVQSPNLLIGVVLPVRILIQRQSIIANARDILLFVSLTPSHELMAII